MKNYTSILLFTFALAFSTTGFAQQDYNQENWHDQTTVGGYASSLLLFTPVNVSFEQLWYNGLNASFGYTAGLTATLSTGEFGRGVFFGTHGAFTLLTGTGNDHFEMKIGLCVNPGGDGLFLIPILTTGYRWQPTWPQQIFPSRLWYWWIWNWLWICTIIR